MARDTALIRLLLAALMPTDEWTADEADPYQQPDDPDNWRDEAEE
jgi:hypothetical protein